MSPSEPAVDDLAVLGERLGHHFAAPDLLATAMAHRSWVAEHRGTTSNERLEFLGDAVLGWVIADLAYRRYGDHPEGVLTDMRKGVVNADALAAVARTLDLGSFLLLGRGEDAAGGRDKTSILSDALEAVFGAVYLDGGPDAAYRVIEEHVGALLDDAEGRLDQLDEKTALQELSARLGRGAPAYEVRAEGPDHRKRFSAVVAIDGEVLGAGAGGSKKAAERAAAREALSALDGRA